MMGNDEPGGAKNRGLHLDRSGLENFWAVQEWEALGDDLLAERLEAMEYESRKSAERIDQEANVLRNRLIRIGVGRAVQKLRVEQRTRARKEKHEGAGDGEK